MRDMPMARISFLLILPNTTTERFKCSGDKESRIGVKQISPVS
jgi:hypothetical protein